MITPPERDAAGKVSLEDLLRLKRSERPAPEFWSRFEEELRVKQLAAIVEKRPWWVTLRLPQAARVLARFQLPVGAAAILALGFVVVREYGPAGGGASETASPVLVANAAGDSVVRAASVPKVESVVVSVLPSAVPVPDNVSTGLVAVARASDPIVSEVPSGEVAAPEIAQSGQGVLTAMIPWAVSHAPSGHAESARTAELGELPQVHFAANMNPGRDHSFDSGASLETVALSSGMVAEAVTVPVQAAPVSPREIRRNRILTDLVIADNNSDVERSRMAQVREVLTSSLDEDRLYDTVRRVGMGGDRLTLKF